MTHWVPVRSCRIACVTSEVRNRSESENLTDEMYSLGQQMSCMRDCIASMFDEQAGLRSKAHAAVQLATTCENTVYRARKSLLGDCTLSVANSKGSGVVVPLSSVRQRLEPWCSH